MKQLPLRPNVCMLVLNKKNKLFLGERDGNPGVWQFPQGGVEEGLTLEENVIKELHEELGAKKKLFTIIKKLNATHEYDFRNVPDYAKGIWRGQTQTFWLVRFTGRNSDIDLSKCEKEFMDFQWCEPRVVEKIAESRRIPGYLPALEECYAYLKENSK